jgi:hypothetical protein
MNDDMLLKCQGCSAYLIGNQASQRDESVPEGKYCDSCRRQLERWEDDGGRTTDSSSSVG